jgi:hypothetical protein
MRKYWRFRVIRLPVNGPGATLHHSRKTPSAGGEAKLPEIVAGFLDRVVSGEFLWKKNGWIVLF